MTQVNLKFRRPDGVTAGGALLTSSDGSVRISAARRYDTDSGEMTRASVVIPLNATVTLASGTWLFELVNVSDGRGGVLSDYDANTYRIVPGTGTYDIDDLDEVTPSGITVPAAPEWQAYLDSLTALPAPEDSHAGYALAWLGQMTRPLEQPTGSGEISLSRLYPTDYTGPIDGSFTPPAGYATQAGTYITVSDPGDLPATFRGTIYGQVTGIANPQNYRVQACKATDALYAMGTAATPDSSGYFAVNVSAVETWRKGEWKLRLELPASPGVAVGGIWPSGTVYTGLTVELHAISDTDYLVSSIPAQTSGAISFLSSSPGIKRLALRGPSSVLLADTEPITGNIRSYLVSAGQPGYGTRFPEQSFVYDQGVALCAAIAAGNQPLAEILMRGLARLQTTSGGQTGGFRFSGRQGSAAYGDPAYRTGAHAIATFAALAYAQAYPGDTGSRAKAVGQAGLDWMAGYLATSGNRQGLYLGGFGTYTADGGGGQTFNEDYSITWASTEHNIDAYFALRIAADVIGGTYAAQADTLAAVMWSKLWNANLQRLNQGLQDTGPDEADPLDVHSWGSIWLKAAGHESEAIETMSTAQLAPFRVSGTAPNGKAVTGYATSYNSVGYPGMTPHVWWEGTFSVAYALGKLGQADRQAAVITAAQPGQFGDGSYPYVSVQDTTYELNPYRSAASTAWAVLASIGSGIFDTGAVYGSAPTAPTPASALGVAVVMQAGSAYPTPLPLGYKAIEFRGSVDPATQFAMADGYSWVQTP